MPIRRIRDHLVARFGNSYVSSEQFFVSLDAPIEWVDEDEMVTVLVLGNIVYERILGNNEEELRNTEALYSSITRGRR